MTDSVFLIARYQTWIYSLLGLIVLFYLSQLWQAHRILGQTPFGLEKEAALSRRNTAGIMLVVLAILIFSVWFVRDYVVPTLAAHPTPDPAFQPTPFLSPTPIFGETGPLVVDSSGCDNPNATLIDPQPDTRISGSYEVRGTANIANFAFYKFEISGSPTNGMWVPLYVGNKPVVGGPLGIFDASTHAAGRYAFRLVVMDNTGQSPPPCVVPVTLVAIGGPAMAEGTSAP